MGIGAGTITLDLAPPAAHGWVVGIDSALTAAVAATKALAANRGALNLRLLVGDVYHLGFADAAFDVVHAHQLVQHLADRWRPFARCAGLQAGWSVAVRDADYSAMTWHPPSAGLTRWLQLYHEVARSNGGEPDAGRRLLGWARDAGFSEIDSSASAWCFAPPTDVAWWSDTWAERLSHSDFAHQAVERGLSDPAELAQLAEAWRRWGKSAAWFAVLHGQDSAAADCLAGQLAFALGTSSSKLGPWGVSGEMWYKHDGRKPGQSA